MACAPTSDAVACDIEDEQDDDGDYEDVDDDDDGHDCTVPFRYALWEGT